MIKATCIALSASLLSLSLTSGLVHAELSNEAVAENFCFALQATSQCDNLQMRLDTEQKIETMVGTEIRGPKSPYRDACMAGIAKAFGDTRICETVWHEFGCYGTTQAGLIQQNPFTSSNPVLCKF